MTWHRERQLGEWGITTIAKLETIPLGELVLIPSWRKEAQKAIETIVQLYLRLQVKKGRLGQITELQLVHEISKILEKWYEEGEYKKRTLKEILEELQSQRVIDEDVINV